MTASLASWTPLMSAMAAITTTAMTIDEEAERLADAGDLALQGGRLLSRSASSISAMEPISVSMPVAVTTARPTPWTTAVPLWTMFVRSPSEAGAASSVATLFGRRLALAGERGLLRRAGGRADESRVGADGVALCTG